MAFIKRSKVEIVKIIDEHELEEEKKKISSSTTKDIKNSAPLSTTSGEK